MNWHAKFGAVLAIFDFSKKVRGRSCPQPFNYSLFSQLVRAAGFLIGNSSEGRWCI